MPYQNLGSEVILAVGIWLLAICTFGMMVLVVLAKLFAENWVRNKHHPRDAAPLAGPAPQDHENSPPKEGEFVAPAWE